MAAVLRNSDVVVVMIDDSILGLSAARFYLSTLRSVVKNIESICFLCSGISVPKDHIIDHIERELHCGPNAWRLPVIPFDPAAARWPGSGSTLYSLGKRTTRNVFEQIAGGLQLIEYKEPEPVRLLPFLSPSRERPAGMAAPEGEPVGVFRSLLQKVANSF